MKKNFYVGLIALTALTVTSCSNDDVVMQSPEVNKAIEFGTYVGRDAVSRGSVITESGSTAGQDNATITTLSLKEKGFGVFAYYTDESSYVNGDNPETTDVTETGSLCNFMYNQKVEMGGGATDWTYSPVKYWPNDPGDKLTFFAYAPYDDADADANQGEVDNISFNTQATMLGDPVITFKVHNTVKNQTDLLFSKSNNKNLIKNKAEDAGIYVDEEVNFEFAHALSRIGFTVKAITDEVVAGQTPNKLDEATTIVVKKVILSGGEHSAAVDANFTAPSEGVFHSQGTLNINQQDVNNFNNQTSTFVTWADGNNDTKQIFTLTNENFATQTQGTESGYFTMYNEQGFILTEDTKILNTTNSTTANKLNADDSYIMIIPQDLSSTGFYVYVEYDVITIDQNIGNNSNTYDGLKSKVTNHISTQVSDINFQSGKAYTLNLQLGMTSVKVTANVDDWSEQTGTSVDLPQNTQQQQQNP